MEEIGLPELTSEQAEEVCEIAEKSARGYILSKVPSRRVSTLNITVDSVGTRPITVTVEVDVTLSPLMKEYDVEELTTEATRKAFASVERYLREIVCKSKK